MSERLATATAALALVLVFVPAHPVLDPDMWWHLAIGEAIWQHRSVHFVDPLSFTQPTVWVNAQWLSEALFALLERFVGIIGLEAFALALKVAAFLFVFASLSVPPLTRVWVTVLFAMGTLPIIGGARPQLFSFLFLAALAWWLHCQRATAAEATSNGNAHPHLTGSWHTFVALPLLFALWANIHSFYPLAFALLLLAVLADWINERRDWQPVLGAQWRRKMLVALALCLVAVMLTPFGWHAPKQVLINIVQSSQLPIEEWKPAYAMRHPLVLLWAGLLTLWFVCLAWSPKRPDALEILWGAFTTFNALTGVRMIALWCLLMAPFVGAHLGQWLASSSRPAPPQWLGRTTAVLCAALAGFLFVFRFSPAEFVKCEQKEYPMQAVNWLHHNGWTGNCLTRYDWGGYVAWRLKERVRVFVDGRADFYSPKVMRDFLTAYFGRARWQQVLRDYPVTLVLVPPDAPIANLLTAFPKEWRCVYRSQQALIFARQNRAAFSPPLPVTHQRATANGAAPPLPVAAKR